MAAPRDLNKIQQAARERILTIYADHAAEVAETQLELMRNAESEEVKRGVASDIAKQIMGSPTQRIEQDIRALRITQTLPIPEEKLNLNPVPLQIETGTVPIPAPTSNRALSPPVVFPPRRKPFSHVVNAEGEKKDEPPKSIEPSMVPE